MSKLSKQALKVDNNTSFPNNNTGYITPTILRTYNDNIIDSMVDEIPYGEFTQSVDVSIAALNAYTASADQLATGSLLITASASSNVITFTKGDGSQFNVTVADTTDLSSLNAFTASATISLNALNVSSASQQVSINALNTYTASASTASIVSSITQLNQATASLQSFSSSALVSISNLNTATASLNTSVTNLNSFSASQLSKDDTLATYTGSNDTKWSNLGAQSGSWITESETGSFAYINKDNNWSANQTFTNITAVSASFTYVQTVYETSSVIYSSGSNQFGDAIDDTQTLYGLVRISGSQQVTGSIGFTGGDVNITDQGRNLNIDVDRTIIKGQKAVLISQSLDVQSGFTASLAAGYAWVGNGVGRAQAVATSSFVVSINTGSLATTGSNTFIGNQTITGSLSTNGGATFGNTSAQYNSVNIVTSKTNFPANVYNAFNINTDGDGQWSAGLYVSTYNSFGSEPAAGLYGGGTGNAGSNNILESYGNLVRINKNTELSGSLAVSASLTVNGSPVVVSSQTGSFIINTGSFATTGSNVFNGNQTISGSIITSGSGGVTINKAGGGNGLTIVGGGIQSSGTITTNGSMNIFGDGGSLTLAKNSNLSGSAYPNVTTYVDITTDPANVYASYQFADSAQNGIGGMAVNSYSSQYGGSPVFMLVGGGNYNGSDSIFGFRNGIVDAWKPTYHKAAVAFTGSAPTILSSSFSGSLITNLTDIYTDVPAVNQIVTLTSASYASLVSGGTVDPNTLYVVSGSSSTALPNGIVSSSAQILNYNIFATTGSNTFVGNQTISGSLRTTGSVIGSKVGAYDFDSLFLGSQLGGTTANGTFFGYGSTDYSFIVGAYAVGFDSELKISADNTGITFGDFNGTSYPSWLKLSPNTGSNPKPIMTRGLEITGSAQGNVVSASITSNTASIDFSLGNYFEVTSSVTPLHLNVTNIKPGTTSTLIISASASSSILFSPNVAQPSGSAYSGSAGSIDILSLVSFNTSKVNVVSTKALV